MSRLARDTKVVVGSFVVSGVVHLVKPEVFEPLMPAWLPAHREVILGSGVAELTCAAGLLHPRTRRLAGWASAGLLVGVFPGNLKMAADAVHTDDTIRRVAAFGRLPLQWPMIRGALKATRG